MNTPTELMKLHAEACQAQVDGTAKEFEYFYEGNWKDATDGPVSLWKDGSLMISPLIHRVKPQPKLRRWKPEEVPVGKVVVAKGYERIRKLITGVTDEGVYVNGCMMSFKATFDTYTLEDGSPCGVVD